MTVREICPAGVPQSAASEYCGAYATIAAEPIAISRQRGNGTGIVDRLPSGARVQRAGVIVAELEADFVESVSDAAVSVRTPGFFAVAGIWT